MPLSFSPLCTPTCLLQLQSFFLLFSVCMGCPSPILWWSVLCFSCFYKPSPLQAQCGREVLLLLPSPSSLFIYSSSGDCPSPLSGTQCAPPSLLNVFFSATCLLFKVVFSSFFPGWGSVCPGSYADLPCAV
jgi:hypothetical protein